MRSMSSGDIFAIIFCAASIICGFIILPVRLGCGRGSRPALRREGCRLRKFGFRREKTADVVTAMNENYPTHLALANQNDTDRDGVRLRA